jgi:hypothetical protein
MGKSYVMITSKILQTDEENTASQGEMDWLVRLRPAELAN